MLPPIAAIAFLLIQLRVSLGWTTWHDQSTMLTSSPIVFRSNASVATHSAVRVDLQETEFRGVELGVVKSPEISATV